MLRRELLRTAAAVPSLVLGGSLSAQSAWPSRPIRLLVGFAPGGASDVLARLLGAELAKDLGVPVVIENKPGQAGSIAADAVAKSAPDGDTILLGTPGMEVINPMLYARLPYDADRELGPVTMLVRVPNLLVINASLGIGSVGDLVAYAKKNPGKLNYASNGNGSASHLAMELFKLMSETDIVHVPYKGSGPAITDLIEGRVQIGMDSFTTLYPQTQKGSLHALGVSTLERIPWYPDIPAVAETVKGYEGSSFIYVAAPSGVPAARIARLNEALGKALQVPTVASRVKDLGMTPAPGTPAQLRDTISAERSKWRPVIDKAGLRGSLQ